MIARQDSKACRALHLCLRGDGLHRRYGATPLSRQTRLLSLSYSRLFGVKVVSSASNSLIDERRTLRGCLSATWTARKHPLHASARQTQSVEENSIESSQNDFLLGSTRHGNDGESYDESQLAKHCHADLSSEKLESISSGTSRHTLVDGLLAQAKLAKHGPIPLSGEDVQPETTNHLETASLVVSRLDTGETSPEPAPMKSRGRKRRRNVIRPNLPINLQCEPHPQPALEIQVLNFGPWSHVEVEAAILELFPGVHKSILKQEHGMESTLLADAICEWLSGRGEFVNCRRRNRRTIDQPWQLRKLLRDDIKAMHKRGEDRDKMVVRLLRAFPGTPIMVVEKALGVDRRAYGKWYASTAGKPFGSGLESAPTSDQTLLAAMVKSSLEWRFSAVPSMPPHSPPDSVVPQQNTPAGKRIGSPTLTSPESSAPESDIEGSNLTSDARTAVDDVARRVLLAASQSKLPDKPFILSSLRDAIPGAQIDLLQRWVRMRTAGGCKKNLLAVNQRREKLKVWLSIESFLQAIRKLENVRFMRSIKTLGDISFAVSKLIENGTAILQTHLKQIGSGAEDRQLIEGTPTHEILPSFAQEKKLGMLMSREFPRLSITLAHAYVQPSPSSPASTAKLHILREWAQSLKVLERARLLQTTRLLETPASERKMFGRLIGMIAIARWSLQGTSRERLLDLLSTNSDLLLPQNQRLLDEMQAPDWDSASDFVLGDAMVDGSHDDVAQSTSHDRPTHQTAESADFQAGHLSLEAMAEYSLATRGPTRNGQAYDQALNTAPGAYTAKEDIARDFEPTTAPAATLANDVDHRMALGATSYPAPVTKEGAKPKEPVVATRKPMAIRVDHSVPRTVSPIEMHQTSGDDNLEKPVTSASQTREQRRRERKSYLAAELGAKHDHDNEPRPAGDAWRCLVNKASSSWHLVPADTIWRLSNEHPQSMRRCHRGILSE